ncbi:portal protein [uncultured Bosea sp.]|uniref:portal protein n=1 Tax=uncultured Bosea sp. TaxID=211457 RepID=UPI002627D0FD|nr:portal protein [uncultured Bosea sp.]
MYGLNDILTRHDELKAIRQPVERQWREIAQLMCPEQEDMFTGNSRTNPAYDELYDATTMQAAEAFSGGIYGQMTNPANNWFEFGLEDTELASYYPVKSWLWRQSRKAYGTFAVARSKFYSEAPGWFGDLGIFGMGTLYSEEIVGAGRFLDPAIPLGESFIDVDAEGDVDTFHRAFRLTGRQAKQKFPELEALGSQVNDRTTYEFIHAVCPNPAYDARRIGLAGKAFLSVYVSPQLKSFIRTGGYHRMPYHVVMWKRRPGRVYPVGPGHIARPEAAMLNEMERTHIVAAQFAADPTILAHDEDTFSPADRFPGAVIYGQVNERGQPLAQPLNTGANLQLSLEMSKERRDAIRQAFYFSVMQLVNRPQMTATEFLGFQEEYLRQMGPNLGRIQSQGLAPLIARRYDILAQAGQIDPPPPELENQPLQIEYTSPLAKMQKAGEAKATLQYVTGMQQVAAATQDIGVMDNIDGDAVAAILHEAMGPPPSARRDPAAVAKLREQRAQLAAQREQLAQAGQAAEVSATNAHAAQAATLSTQREAGQ